MQTNARFVCFFFWCKKPGEQDDFEAKIVRDKVSACESDKSGKYWKSKYDMILHVSLCAIKKIVCLFVWCAKITTKGLTA